jgi:hypothetical protein
MTILISFIIGFMIGAWGRQKGLNVSECIFLSVALNLVILVLAWRL